MQSYYFFTQTKMFQVILATNEKVSFAIFRYENPYSLQDVQDLVGFSSGRNKSDNILNVDAHVYRIEGK